MPSAFESFLAGGGEDASEPPDGNHTATLVRAVIRQSSKTGDDFVVTEWQTTDLAHYWTNWGGTVGGAIQHTLRFIKELGVDPDKCTSFDQLGDELAPIEGQVFTVKVQRNGDYLNTYVVGKPEHVQTEMPVEPPVPAVKSGGMFEDDVPF